MHLRRAALALGVVATAALVLSLAAGATIPVIKIATDPFTNASSQHKAAVKKHNRLEFRRSLNESRLDRFMASSAKSGCNPLQCEHTGTPRASAAVLLAREA